jgi:hypothetical protein
MVLTCGEGEVLPVRLDVWPKATLLAVVAAHTLRMACLCKELL